MRKILAAAAVVVLTGFSLPSHADPCSVAPFNDVPASDGFCSSVEWIKNRGVTLGCNPAGTNYCPGEGVSRIQMALFMQRLGDALLPDPVQSNQSPGAMSLTSDPVGDVHCTALVPAKAYPRRLIVNASGSFTTGAAEDIGLLIVYTLDGDTTNYLIATPFEMITTASQATWGHVSHSTVIDVPGNATVKVGAAFFTPIGAAAVTDSRCQLTGQIQSRRGATSPF